MEQLALVILSSVFKITAAAFHKSCHGGFECNESAFWPLREWIHERENIPRAKNVCLFFPALISQLPLTVIKFYQQETWDAIFSCSMLPFLRASATNLLNQHTPQTPTPPPSLAIIFCEGNLRLRKFYVFQAAHRGWLHGYSLAIHVICFLLLFLKPPCDDDMTALDFILVPAGLRTLVCFQRSVDQHFYFLFFCSNLRQLE